jgi:DNA-binding MarR family transcriptional regulator
MEDMEEGSIISITDYQYIVQSSPMPKKGPAEAAPGGLSQWISFLVGRVAHAARADFQTRLAPLKLTPKQFSLLVAVREAGASSQAKLGAMLGVDRNTIVLLVDDLESRSMVRRCSLEGDRRANSVTITRMGLRVLEKAEVLAANSEGQIYASLSRSQREQFRCLLLQIVLGREKRIESGKQFRR